MRAGRGEAVDQPGSINARILAVGPAVLRSGCAGRGREKVGICVLCPAGVSRTGGSNRISPQGPTDCSNARRFELRDGIVIRSHCQDLDLGAVGRMTCLITEQPIVTFSPDAPSPSQCSRLNMHQRIHVWMLRTANANPTRSWC